jgi:predicted nucleic acid-binding protein
MLVVDAGVAATACLSDVGFSPFQDERLVAPPLLWSETRSTLHTMAWRGAAAADVARAAAGRLDSAPIQERRHDDLGREAWRIADELGWAKTYDAEYLALALLLDCRLVTLDRQMRRRTADFGFVVLPEEI